MVFLFLHLRLNVPEMFTGFLVQYWTLVVLLLAFLGVGLSELCERHRLRVLAAPLQRTGIFLPLIPILSFWVRPPAELIAFADESAPGLRPMLVFLQARPWQFDRYALVWFLAAALYGAVALARHSTNWAIAAALAANFGLWALFMHVGVGFLVHPQAWVIPLGVIVLASEYLNRDRLTAEAAQALRYLGISLIYVASTADLFLAGLGNSVWLPVVLAVLCVAGVLAGILLRVRAFLFVGVGFLLVDLFTMIWYAAVDRARRGCGGRAASCWGPPSWRCSPCSRSAATTCWTCSMGCGSGNDAPSRTRGSDRQPSDRKEGERHQGTGNLVQRRRAGRRGDMLTGAVLCWPGRIF